MRESAIECGAPYTPRGRRYRNRKDVPRACVACVHYDYSIIDGKYCSSAKDKCDINMSNIKNPLFQYENHCDEWELNERVICK